MPRDSCPIPSLLSDSYANHHVPSTVAFAQCTSSVSLTICVLPISTKNRRCVWQSASLLVSLPEYTHFLSMALSSLIEGKADDFQSLLRLLPGHVVPLVRGPLTNVIR